MAQIVKSHLDPKRSYLQIALNGTIEDATQVIAALPQSDRIIVEAGTPFIKMYGAAGIRHLYDLWSAQLLGISTPQKQTSRSSLVVELFAQLATHFEMEMEPQGANSPSAVAARGSGAPYIVADLKTMDRAETEVRMVKSAGASAAIALGMAPIETLNTFIDSCGYYGLDAMVDMMNVEYPLAVLQKLRKIPPIVILHRGVDEEALNKEKMIPLHEIRRIKGMYDVMISVAGGDTIREVQRSVFNDADIVVIWKSVFERTDKTEELVREFLAEVN